MVKVEATAALAQVEVTVGVQVLVTVIFIGKGDIAVRQPNRSRGGWLPSPEQPTPRCKVCTFTDQA